MQIKQQPDELQTQGRPEYQAAYARSTARALLAVLRLQALVGITLALGLLWLGPVPAYSSLCGGVAVYVPCLLFTALVSRKIGAGSVAFLGTAALAEFGKLLLTGLLCALVFVWVRPLAPLWFFVGMLSVLATGWLGLAKAIR